jgi:hypothetical protein
MNIYSPPNFTPPLPPIPDEEPGWYRFFVAVRTNALQIWPRRAYEQDVLAGSGFGRKRFLLNAPKAIHRVMVENTANYVRTPVTIRILGPIVGKGLLLSEGEDWRHQRRTIAPALAPRVMPVLARHVASAAQETIARLAADAREPVANARTHPVHDSTSPTYIHHFATYSLRTVCKQRRHTAFLTYPPIAVQRGESAPPDPSGFIALAPCGTPRRSLPLGTCCHRGDS